REFLLVTHLECGSADRHRLAFVAREPLQCIGRSLLGDGGAAERKRREGQKHRCGRSSHWAPALPSASCGVNTMTTSRSNRTRSPESLTSNRFALRVPCFIVTSTGCSDTM